MYERFERGLSKAIIPSSAGRASDDRLARQRFRFLLYLLKMHIVPAEKNIVEVRETG